ncbi:MAG: hypothetical protein QHH18_08135 [Candidatus Bathyarchaeota archaeon]|nr:hypothetical protein [Candidatus Bathyarchaeota archaeon A05DMB-5]MDH7558549.1 hypothetical protein [Candidatus Bathyarchaeota archaeon]
MKDRMKIFLIVAALGFAAGVIADITAEYVIPAIMTVLPEVLKARYVISGFAGACLTLVMVSIWAYVTGPSEK